MVFPISHFVKYNIQTTRELNEDLFYLKQARLAQLVRLLADPEIQVQTLPGQISLYKFS